MEGDTRRSEVSWVRLPVKSNRLSPYPALRQVTSELDLRDAEVPEIGLHNPFSPCVGGNIAMTYDKLQAPSRDGAKYKWPTTEWGP